MLTCTFPRHMPDVDLAALWAEAGPGPGSRAGGFGDGQCLDTAPGGAGLHGFAEAAADDPARLGEVDDDELMGLICALDRAEAAACAAKLAVAAELIRRRPATGYALEGAARMPRSWDEFAADEVRWALAETQRARRRPL